MMNLKTFMRTKLKTQVRANPVIDESSAPTFLMVGSLSGITKKDAWTFVRGQAANFVSSPEEMRINAMEHSGRWFYEIHQGGPGYSILPKVIEELEAERSVRIGTANGGFVEIHDELNEVYSLQYGAEDRFKKEVGVAGQVEQEVAFISDFIDLRKSLVELYPQQVKLQLAGAISMVLAAILFMVTGTLYTFTQSGVLDVDAMVSTAKAGHVSAATDNPVWQLDRARTEADAAKTTVSTLKRDGKSWTWELAK